jgi:hypothetical protein
MFSKEETRKIIPFLNLDSTEWRNHNTQSDELAICVLTKAFNFFSPRVVKAGFEVHMQKNHWRRNG